jgi:hypothetical protein
MSKYDRFDEPQLQEASNRKEWRLSENRPFFGVQNPVFGVWGQNRRKSGFWTFLGVFGCF